MLGISRLSAFILPLKGEALAPSWYGQHLLKPPRPGRTHFSKPSHNEVLCSTSVSVSYERRSSSHPQPRLNMLSCCGTRNYPSERAVRRGWWRVASALRHLALEWRWMRVRTAAQAHP